MHSASPLQGKSRAAPSVECKKKCLTSTCTFGKFPVSASLAQLVEHALRKRMVVGSIPTGGSLMQQHQESIPHGRSSEMWARPRAALRTPRPLETSRLQGRALRWLFPTEILRSGPARRHVLPQSVDLPWTGLSDFPCTAHRLSKEKVAQLQVLSAKKSV